MRGDQNDRQEALFCEDDDFDDVEEVDGDMDFDDDEYDDVDLFDDINGDYQSDAHELFRRRGYGSTDSTASFLRSASLLAMPTFRRGVFGR